MSLLDRLPGRSTYVSYCRTFAIVLNRFITLLEFYLYKFFSESTINSRYQFKECTCTVEERICGAVSRISISPEPGKYLRLA